LKNTLRTLSLVALILAIGATLFYFEWKQGEPKRSSVAALQNLNTALQSGDGAALLSLIAIPKVVAGRSAPEQSEFLRKALQDEISAEGLEVLNREGQFGQLTNIFPVEAQKWATQAGAKPGDCVAFKLERPAICAEVVLVRDPSLPGGNPKPIYRVVRLNNVRQLAESNVLNNQKAH
jgi:hypothetical protein